jgi:hypothetical protein
MNKNSAAPQSLWKGWLGPISVGAFLIVNLLVHIVFRPYYGQEILSTSFLACVAAN